MTTRIILGSSMLLFQFITSKLIKEWQKREHIPLSYSMFFNMIWQQVLNPDSLLQTGFRLDMDFLLILLFN